MSTISVLYTNEIKAQSGVLTAQSANATFPVTNVQTDNYAKTYRSTAAGATVEFVKVDLGVATEIKAVALMNVNLRSTATVQIEGHATDAFGAPTFQETITATGLGAEDTNLYKKLSSAQTFRWWRVTMLDNGNPAGHIELGEWFLGAHIELTDAFDNTNSRQRIRNNVEHRTDGNQGFIYSRQEHWNFGLSWTTAQQATRDELRALDRAVNGNGLPFIFVADDLDPAESFFVRKANPGLIENRIHFDNWNLRMNLIEETRGLSTPAP